MAGCPRRWVSGSRSLQLLATIQLGRKKLRMTKTRIDRSLQIGIVLLLGAFVYSIYAGIHERVVAQGDQAPAFHITADNGRTVTVPDFGGKLLVLNFWA